MSQLYKMVLSLFICYWPKTGFQWRTQSPMFRSSAHFAYDQHSETGQVHDCASLRYVRILLCLFSSEYIRDPFCGSLRGYCDASSVLPIIQSKAFAELRSDRKSSRPISRVWKRAITLLRAELRDNSFLRDARVIIAHPQRRSLFVDTYCWN